MSARRARPSDNIVISCSVAVRHTKFSEVAKLKVKLEECFEAAALATGCKMEIKWVMQYLDMQDS